MQDYSTTIMLVLSRHVVADLHHEKGTTDAVHDLVAKSGSVFTVLGDSFLRGDQSVSAIVRVRAHTHSHRSPVCATNTNIDDV